MHCERQTLYIGKINETPPSTDGEFIVYRESGGINLFTARIDEKHLAGYLEAAFFGGMARHVLRNGFSEELQTITEYSVSPIEKQKVSSILRDAGLEELIEIDETCG